VLLERAQVAEAAKQSHPVREDGPAKQTLFEILATAFAARGHSVSDAEWDATREQGDSWVVHLTWKAGLTENEALWTFTRTMGSRCPNRSSQRPWPRILTDPNFAQPVRSLSAVRADIADGADLADAAATDESGEATGQGQPEVVDRQDDVVEGDFLRDPSEDGQPNSAGARPSRRTGRTCCSACARIPSARSGKPLRMWP